MGWMTGFEPATAGTTIRCSTAELHPPRKNGTPKGIRTPDLRIRNPLLYPTELLAQHKFGSGAGT